MNWFTYSRFVKTEETIDKDYIQVDKVVLPADLFVEVVNRKEGQSIDLNSIASSRSLNNQNR